MARIKGWKKTTNEKTWIEWQMFRSPWSRIVVRKNRTVYPWKGWHVEYKTIHNQYFKKSFKTKIQALKFAIDWMKKHSKGYIDK